MIVNSGNIANNAKDQNATGGSVINGAVTVNGGTFNGRVETYDGTPVIKGGTFKYLDAVVDVSMYVPEGYKQDANGKVIAPDYVAKIGEQGYETLKAAFKAATSGCTIEILADVTVDSKWDCRDYVDDGSHSQFKESVTINGNGHTLKFTGTISDGNWYTIFRFEEDAVVNNLTVDISEATGAQRVISAKKSLTVDGLTIIGSAKYGIIFGEGASAADLAVAEIVIKNSNLTGTRRAISDNEGGKDVKSIDVTGNTLNANVYLSASESITFNNNTVAGDVDLRSYSAENVLSVEATGNTLTKDVKNYIYAKTINAQEEFETKRPAFKVATKAELEAALAAAQTGDTITLMSDISSSEIIVIDKANTLDGNGKKLTFTADRALNVSGANGVTIKNLTINASGERAINIIQNATNVTVEMLPQLLQITL